MLHRKLFTRMTITERVQYSSTKLDREPPASEEVIGKLIPEAGLKLPEDYWDFLLQLNGGEKELGIQRGWFRTQRAEEVIQAGLETGVPKCAHGFFAFGGNGGGELLAFDTLRDIPWPMVALPFTAMNAGGAMHAAGHFNEFVAQMGKAFQE